jgi:hypothetical protein
VCRDTLVRYEERGKVCHDTLVWYEGCGKVFREGSDKVCPGIFRERIVVIDYTFFIEYQ